MQREYHECIGSVVSAAIKKSIEDAVKVAAEIGATGIVLAQDDVMLCIHGQIAQWVGRVETMIADMKTTKFANVVANRNTYMKAGKHAMTIDLSLSKKD